VAGPFTIMRKSVRTANRRRRPRRAHEEPDLGDHPGGDGVIVEKQLIGIGQVAGDGVLYPDPPESIMWTQGRGFQRLFHHPERLFPWTDPGSPGEVSPGRRRHGGRPSRTGDYPSPVMSCCQCRTR